MLDSRESGFASADDAVSLRSNSIRAADRRIRSPTKRAELSEGCRSSDLPRSSCRSRRRRELWLCAKRGSACSILARAASPLPTTLSHCARTRFARRIGGSAAPQSAPSSPRGADPLICRDHRIEADEDGECGSARSGGRHARFSRERLRLCRRRCLIALELDSRGGSEDPQPHKARRALRGVQIL